MAGQIGNPKVGFRVRLLFNEGLYHVGRQLVSRNRKLSGCERGPMPQGWAGGKGLDSPWAGTSAKSDCKITDGETQPRTQHDNRNPPRGKKKKKKEDI